MAYIRKFGAGSGHQNTLNGRLVCQFLIDTLPIRIARKSFDCIVGVHSNRHSSAPLNMEQFAKVAVEFCTSQKIELTDRNESAHPREGRAIKKLADALQTQAGAYRLAVLLESKLEIPSGAGHSETGYSGARYLEAGLSGDER